MQVRYAHTPEGDYSGVSTTYQVIRGREYESKHHMNSMSGDEVRNIVSSGVFLGVPIKSHLSSKSSMDDFGNTGD